MELLVVIVLWATSCLSVVGTGTDRSDIVFSGDYGVDVSYPIHHFLDGERSSSSKLKYERLMNGCYEKFSKLECDENESARLSQNLRQPPEQHNYTQIGFKLMKLPKGG